MLDRKTTDNQVRNWIIMTIGENENGASWEKLNRILGSDGPAPQLKRVLEGLGESGHVYLKGKRYQFTKKGRKTYKALNISK